MDADGLQECFASVLVEAELERATNTMAVAAAVYGGVGLADRLRAATGHEVTLHVSGGPQPDRIEGAVMEVTETSAAISRAGRSWIVRLSAVAVARGLPPGHRRPEGPVQQRLGLASQLRALVGEQVRVAVAGEVLTGPLRRVGRDHIEVGYGTAAAVVPFASLAWVGTGI